jgi:hypothetical protein
LEKQLRQLARKKRLTESGMTEPEQKRQDEKKTAEFECAANTA